MQFLFLSEQIRELRTRDYRRIGLRGNPAYCELHRGDDVKVHIPREPLESTIKSMIDEYANDGNPKHIYLFSREGGAGKSHTNKVMEEYCHQKELPVIIWDNDKDDRDIDDSVQAIQYLIHILELPDAALERISEHITSPGDALNMLGAMLAVAAYKAKNGNKPKITVV